MSFTPQPLQQDDEIDLRRLVLTLWRQRMMIVVIALICAAFGLAVSVASSRYVSEGLFLTHDLNMGNFKRYEAVLGSGPHLRQFLQLSEQTDQPGADGLTRLINTPGALNDAIRPEFSFTDRDQRFFGVRLPDDDPGSMIGLRLHHESPATTGGAPVLLLAEFVRDTIIRLDMEPIMHAQCLKYRASEQTLRNEQLQSEFDISQQEQRAGTLRDIIERTPKGIAFDNRQNVSIEGGVERFLSPDAQLSAAEILIADMRLAEVTRERQRIASAIKRNFYCAAQSLIQQPITGRSFLQQLDSLQTAAFEQQDKSIDIVEQTWNELDVQRQAWLHSYLTSMRFVATPEGAEIKQRPIGLALGLALGGMLGGMLGMFIALVRAWWRDGREHVDTIPRSPQA